MLKLPDLYYNIIIVRKTRKNNKNICNWYKDIENMQIRIQENQKEIKDHGDYAYPFHVCVEHIEAYEQGMFRWHWHPEIELTLALSGEMEYHINNSTYVLRKGEALFGNSNTLHSGIQIGKKECAYLSITFHPRFLYGYENSGLQTKYVNFITENGNWDSLKLRKNVDWQREAIARMEEIHGLAQDRPEDYELQVHILLMQIWQQLFRYFSQIPGKREEPEKNIQRLREMIAYMEAHYDENVTLDDIAGCVNICKSECCRFFKKYMNMTIMEYLLFLRIQNSLPLLKQGESISRTADMVGFTSSAYFGQIFKRYMKCTPKEYRAKSHERA